MLTYKTSPKITNAELSELFANAWTGQIPTEYANQLTSDNVWVCAYDGGKLVGFVRVVWDAGKHGFVLDTTTHTDYQNHGIGTELLSRVAAASRDRGIKWLHVDFESRLTEFYRRSGFQHTEAGLMNLESDTPIQD